MAPPPSAPAPPLDGKLPGAGEMQANADIVEGYMASVVQQIWPGNPPHLSARIDGWFVQLTVEFPAPGEAA